MCFCTGYQTTRRKRVTGHSPRGADLWAGYQTARRKMATSGSDVDLLLFSMLGAKTIRNTLSGLSNDSSKTAYSALALRCRSFCGISNGSSKNGNFENALPICDTDRHSETRHGNKPNAPTDPSTTDRSRPGPFRPPIRWTFLGLGGWGGTGAHAGFSAIRMGLRIALNPVALKTLKL